MNSYPKCIRSFMEVISSDTKLLSKYKIHNIKNVRPFDVTLRDGLQSLSNEEQLAFKTDDKKIIYKYIIQKYDPKNLEIGSCINKKLLPIFNDTEELFNYSKLVNKQTNHYVLVPNYEQLLYAIKFGARNFSFITSVSNSFQIKNTKMTIEQSYNEINNMMVFLDDSPLKDYNIKLYVSCISKCPIEGNITINTIIDNLVKLHKLRPDKLCLSDTCGELQPVQLYNIIQGLMFNKLDLSRFSLHLHVKPERELEVEKLFHLALDYGINEFDVSYLKSGGCSVTMDKNKIAPNMSYEQYYKFLTTYLINNDNL
jgi:hydroxymethylglutaryl-CoA lyase